MFDETGFSSAFDMMNPQGNPLELGSMLAHNPEGVISQLAAEGITPQQFESRFGSGSNFGAGGGLTSGQLLSGSGVFQRYPQFDEGRLGAEGAIQPIPVQTQSIRPPQAASNLQQTVQQQRAPGVEAPAPSPAADAADVATASPAPGAAPPAAGANPAMDAKAQSEKKVADLVKLLSGVKAPPAPQVQLPRPGTVGPAAPRPINPQSAVAALLQQVLAGQKPGPSLGSVIRR